MRSAQLTTRRRGGRVASKPTALVYSTIPVRRSEDRLWETDSRWAMDIGTQLTFHSIKLLCPLQEHLAADPAPLSCGIEVVDVRRVDLEVLVEQADLVQLPGNFGWRRGKHARRLARVARRHGKPVFVGISSNRARTAWLNRRKGALGIVRGLIGWLDVRTSQWFLAKRSSGVFVVGQGITHLARPNPNVHVATASWIGAQDIFDRPAAKSLPIRICCASRLEPMKGVDIGVYAVGQLASTSQGLEFDIVGEGPEREALEDAVERAALKPITRFMGQLAYPDEFLSYLRTVDFVLLTNLGDEQPRLIFDAISQGCIPICPDSAPYVALGLDERFIYQRGRPESAAAALLRLTSIEKDERRGIEAELRNMAREFTLEAMHRRRAEWMKVTTSR